MSEGGRERERVCVCVDMFVIVLEAPSNALRPGSTGECAPGRQCGQGGGGGADPLNTVGLQRRKEGHVWRPRARYCIQSFERLQFVLSVHPPGPYLGESCRNGCEPQVYSCRRPHGPQLPSGDPH